MRRREFLVAAFGLAAPRLAVAQIGGRMPTVGFVGFASSQTDTKILEPFHQRLRELGYVEGRTIAIEALSSEGDAAKGAELISQLIARPVTVFLSPGPAATRAIARQTTIPVVAIALPAAQSEPGLFDSLARPGGSVTGFSVFGEELSEKRIELLKEMLPRGATVGVLHNTTDPTSRNWGEQTLAELRRQGLTPVRMGLTSSMPEPLAEHIRRLGAEGGGAMIVIRDFLTSTLKDEICKVAAQQRVIVVGEHAEFPAAGAMLSYGADVAELFRRAADYVDRIIKGERAGELPIQLPTKFALVINLKTARLLGVEIPARLLARADEVIE